MPRLWGKILENSGCSKFTPKLLRFKTLLFPRVCAWRLAQSSAYNMVKSWQCRFATNERALFIYLFPDEEFFPTKSDENGFWKNEICKFYCRMIFWFLDDSDKKNDSKRQIRNVNKSRWNNPSKYIKFTYNF